MANPATDLRTAIVNALNAITAISGLASACTVVSDGFGLLSKSGQIFVAYTGLHEEGGRLLGAVSRTPVRLVFEIGAVATSFLTPTAAQSKTLGTDALTEHIRTLRASQFTAGSASGVMLLLRSEEVVEHPDRMERGGPVMVVCRYETTPLFI